MTPEEQAEVYRIYAEAMDVLYTAAYALNVVPRTILVPPWLSDNEIAEIRQHIDGKRPPYQGETLKVPDGGWWCFHCGAHFMTYGAAELHFGVNPLKPPVCIAVESEKQSREDWLASQAFDR